MDAASVTPASAERSTAEPLPPRQRSRVTNGASLFVEGRMTGAWQRRFADVLGQIIADISGPEGLSEGQRQLARRAATIAITCEKMEGRAAAGEDINLELYGRLSDRLGRCFQRLGLKRQARDVGMTLLDARRALLAEERAQQP
jgi:hypothetical protein